MNSMYDKPVPGCWPGRQYRELPQIGGHAGELHAIAPAVVEQAREWNEYRRVPATAGPMGVMAQEVEKLLALGNGIQ